MARLMWGFGCMFGKLRANFLYSAAGERGVTPGRFAKLSFAFALGLLLAASVATAARARSWRIIAFGDSLSAGYQLPASAAFPNVLDEHAYALEISGESMLPVYRDGDVIIVSPAAPVRRGDRVVVRTREGEVLAKELKRQTGKTLELKSFNAEHEDRVFGMSDVDWIARIVWSSQ